jgi:hypothetical protein
MKLGILISSVIVLVLIALIVVASMGFADAPTIATRKAGALAKVELPADLPPIALRTGSADVQPIYEQLLTLYKENPAVFNGEDPPPPSVAQTAAELLIRAMEEGDVSEPFLDKHLPMRLNAEPYYTDALVLMPVSMALHAERLKDQGQRAEAIRLERAIFALGQRVFEKCIRMHHRYQGLRAMAVAATDLYNWSAGDEALSAEIDPWADPNGTYALGKVVDQWKDKAEIVQTLKPQVGDLLNVAENDQDLSWRIEAVLALGARKRNPGTRGNRRAILNAIEKYRNSSNPLIAQAAQASHDLQSLDEVY